VEPEQEAARHSGAGRGVGGVLRKFHHEAIAICAQRKFFLGIRVFPESGW
jgi:hypothetical protein